MCLLRASEDARPAACSTAGEEHVKAAAGRVGRVVATWTAHPNLTGPSHQVYYTAAVHATGETCNGYTEICSIIGGSSRRPPRCELFEKSGKRRSIFSCARINNATDGTDVGL